MCAARNSSLSHTVSSNFHEDKCGYILHHANMSNLLLQLYKIQPPSSSALLHLVLISIELLSFLTLTYPTACSGILLLHCMQQGQMAVWVFSVFFSRHTDYSLYTNPCSVPINYCFPLWNPWKISEITYFHIQNLCTS